MFNEIQFKKIIFSLLSALLLALSVFAAAKTYTEIKGAKYIGLNSDIKNTFSVSASGEVFREPDIAKIGVSVAREAKTAVAAQAEASSAVNSIIGFLESSGVERKDIKTVSYGIAPRYDYIADKGRIFRGYEAKHTLEVTIRNLDSVGKILSGAADRGANLIGSVSFAIKNEDEAKREARAKAIAKARERAENLAKELGVNLVRLVSYFESWQTPPIFRGQAFESKFERINSLPDVPPGENKVSVRVNLTYEIK